MTATAHEDADIAAIREDLQALRSDVRRLLAHLNGRVLDTARATADGIGDGICDAGVGAAYQSLRSARALGAWVERKPLLAFFIAASAGYIGARALSR